jgi:hypothetical protein
MLEILKDHKELIGQIRKCISLKSPEKEYQQINCFDLDYSPSSKCIIHVFNDKDNQNTLDKIAERVYCTLNIELTNQYNLDVILQDEKTMLQLTWLRIC